LDGAAPSYPLAGRLERRVLRAIAYDLGVVIRKIRERRIVQNALDRAVEPLPKRSRRASCRSLASAGIEYAIRHAYFSLKSSHYLPHVDLRSFSRQRISAGSAACASYKLSAPKWRKQLFQVRLRHFLPLRDRAHRLRSRALALSEVNHRVYAIPAAR
jgi:hypothetical protein